ALPISPRHPGDQPAKHRDLSAFPRSARGVRRTDCKRECEDAGARNFSIPPCCPASGRETHVADQKTLRDEKDHHGVARGSAMHDRASSRSMRDEAAPRHVSHATRLARVQPDDRVAAGRAWRSSSTTRKFSRFGCSPALSAALAKQALAAPRFYTNLRSTDLTTMAIAVTAAHNFANNSPWRV